MCSEKTKFEEVKTAETQTLNLANNDSTKIKGIGTIKLKTKEGLIGKLEETLYVPDLRSNLSSVAKITEHGFEVICRRNAAIITNSETKEKLMFAHQNGNLYYELTEDGKIAQAPTSSLREWHERFGHLNVKELKYIIHQKKVDGINIKIEGELPA
ncbi:transposon ty5-1 protein [Lasius niger]|uniref:Transposon ty5-1 protein n=1 Tax=Lasius niger TaxID=67767 RepID=A0A0J7KIR9_LASNI|nr:transposon ty5-1 protein [Lasius niger]